MENKAYTPVLWKMPSPVPLPQLDFLLTVTTIVKTVIGSGILTLPYTMSKMGYVFGAAIFIVAGDHGRVRLCSASEGQEPFPPQQLFNYFL
jgi:hypothetical protein